MTMAEAQDLVEDTIIRVVLIALVHIVLVLVPAHVREEAELAVHKKTFIKEVLM